MLLNKQHLFAHTVERRCSTRSGKPADRSQSSAHSFSRSPAARPSQAKHCRQRLMLVCRICTSSLKFACLSSDWDKDERGEDDDLANSSRSMALFVRCEPREGRRTQHNRTHAQKGASYLLLGDSEGRVIVGAYCR